jgi:hypothetical protein
MLTIFLFIGIATMFSRKAFDKDRNRYLWGTIGVLSYFLTQFVAGVIVNLINPELLVNKASLYIISMLSGFSGVGIAYTILNRLPDLAEESLADDNILDSQL